MLIVVVLVRNKSDQLEVETVHGEERGLNIIMEKRTFNRIPVDIEIKFVCCNKAYSGTLMNVSKVGMFIMIDELFFPFDSRMDVFIPYKDDMLRISVGFIRIVMSPDSFDGIGVKLLNPSRRYVDFVSSQRAVTTNRKTVITTKHQIHCRPGSS